MEKTPETSVYEICIQGHLSSRRARQLGPLSVSHRSDGTSVLVGPVSDQAFLHGLLSRIRDLGIPLISVQRQGSNDR